MNATCNPYAGQADRLKKLWFHHGMLTPRKLDNDPVENPWSSDRPLKAPSLHRNELEGKYDAH